VNHTASSCFRPRSARRGIARFAIAVSVCLLAVRAAATDEPPPDASANPALSQSVANAAAFGGPGSTGVDLAEEARLKGSYLPSGFIGRITQPY
jgi:hypothetical protein